MFGSAKKYCCSLLQEKADFNQTGCTLDVMWGIRKHFVKVKVHRITPSGYSDQDEGERGRGRRVNSFGPVSPLGQQGTIQITESEAFGRAFDSRPLESKNKNTQLVT